MHYLYLLTRPIAALSAIALLTLAVGCSKSTDSGTTGSASLATSQTISSPQAKAPSKLGDLSTFRKIAADVAACKKAIAGLLSTFDSLTNKALIRENESI